MKQLTPLDIRTVADGLGIVGATACALHCIAVPTLLVLGAAVPAFFPGEEFHKSMLWLVVPSAAIAFSFGCWRHKDRWVLLLGALGAAGLVLSGAVLHDLIGEAGERGATLGSVGLLIAAHVRNFRLCRSESRRHNEV